MFHNSCRVPIFIGSLLIVLLSSCGSIKKPDGLNLDLDSIKEKVSQSLDLDLGQSVSLDIPLDVFCGFLGTPGKTCREQVFASEYNYFRMYPAIHNRFPALVFTRVSNDGKEVELEDGRANYLLAGLNLTGNMEPVSSVSKSVATKAVNSFRDIFPTAPQVFTLEYESMLDLFSTVGQEVPKGQNPIKNHLGLKIKLQDDGSVHFNLATHFGTATISEIPLNSALPVWIEICPGNCGPDQNYFLPPVASTSND